ncbi:ribosome maturation factor RimP [Salinimicrobium catena]|uniref:Ribosome maturation factor RimP n=1 Tax=Salinimicrobium catena TaxID=390640 RepID=A0A1H5H9T4_9FLAO|nr:ribosome assembly cofactor RimP [Salinimicrobium catena]SDK68643.1 ribosome maturation factor RimP [Salinimicrobium catena]SEE24680.1 ribosome maturation factor RimP [Salinimicrobium catena]
MLREKVENLLQEAFEENKSLFLIELNIDNANHISVVIDGDNGVSVNDCIAVSRKIEHNLDRDEEDFSLDVASAGVSQPLKMPRQYRKNIGRKLAVTTIEGEKIEGNLVEMEGDKITLQWKAREPKPVGKGKVTVTKEAVLSLEEIKEAKVIITF